MIDLGNLVKSKAEKEQIETNERINQNAREMFIDLLERQLTFQDSMRVLEILRGTLASWGSNWLDNKFLNHIKKDIEEQKKA